MLSHLLKTGYLTRSEQEIDQEQEYYQKYTGIIIILRILVANRRFVIIYYKWLVKHSNVLTYNWTFDHSDWRNI